MMRTAVKSLLLTLLCGIVFVHPSGATSPSIQGDWIGQIDFGGEWQRINFHFAGEKGTLSGTLDLPQSGRNDIPLSQINLESSKLHIEWQGRVGLGTFQGELKEGVISGEFKQGESKGTFRVIHVLKAAADAKLYSDYAGSY